MKIKIKEKKYYFCPTCKNFPDKIIEVYTQVNETRKWNGKTYELDYSDFGDQETAVKCEKCNTFIETFMEERK